MRYEHTKRIILRALIFGFRFTIFGFVTTLQSVCYFFVLSISYAFVFIVTTTDYVYLRIFSSNRCFSLSVQKTKKNVFFSFEFLPLFSLQSFIAPNFFLFMNYYIQKCNVYNNWWNGKKSKQFTYCFWNSLCFPLHHIVFLLLLLLMCIAGYSTVYNIHISFLDMLKLQWIILT